MSQILALAVELVSYPLDSRLFTTLQVTREERRLTFALQRSPQSTFSSVGSDLARRTHAIMHHTGVSREVVDTI